MRTIVRFACVAFALTIVSGFGAGVAETIDDEFRFKWPYRPGTSAPTTTSPFQGGHADAWDLDIGGGGVNGEVVSSAEGTVTVRVSGFNPNTCNPSDGGGFGNHAKVAVPSTTITMTYAHLQSVSVSLNDRILQGDQVGIEGKTGFTIGSEAPNNCGTHLHWQFDPAPPMISMGRM